MTEAIVIIGAGQAAVQAITSLRAEGYDGPIILVGDELHPPYQRPPLSKKFLAGEFDVTRLYLKPAEFYSGGHIRTCFGVRGTAISRSERVVTLSSGEQVRYQKLLLATGSRVRELNVPGVGLAGIHYLRTVAAKPYDQVPWFWSDQYDVKLQIAGLSHGYTDFCRTR